MLVSSLSCILLFLSGQNLPSKLASVRPVVRIKLGYVST
jgi:hypothetical protein